MKPETILVTVFFFLTQSVFSQVKYNDDYIIIHPNFETGDERRVIETISESTSTKFGNNVVKSSIIQDLKIIDKDKNGYSIRYTFINNKLRSLDSTLNKLYHTSNSFTINELNNVKVNIDKWGYFNSVLFANLSANDIELYEANFIKYSEYIDTKHTKDSLKIDFNYSSLKNKIVKNKKFTKNSISELLSIILILPSATFDRIIPIKNESIDTINTRLNYINGKIDVVSTKKYQDTKNTFKLQSLNKFIIPKNLLPFDYKGQQINHFECEENQTFILEKDTGWPISEIIVMKKVFNDQTVITKIEKRFEKL